MAALRRIGSLAADSVRVELVEERVAAHLLGLTEPPRTVRDSVRDMQVSRPSHFGM